MVRRIRRVEVLVRLALAGLVVGDHETRGSLVDPVDGAADPQGPAVPEGDLDAGHSPAAERELGGHGREAASGSAGVVLGQEVAEVLAHHPARDLPEPQQPDSPRGLGSGELLADQGLQPIGVGLRPGRTVAGLGPGVKGVLDEPVEYPVHDVALVQGADLHDLLRVLDLPDAEDVLDQVAMRAGEPRLERGRRQDTSGLGVQERDARRPGPRSG